MNFQNNRKKEKAAQMRTIYVTLAIAVIVMAVLVLLSGSWRRAKETANGTENTTEVNANIPDQEVMAPQTDSGDESEETKVNAAVTETDGTSYSDETDPADATTAVTTAKPTAAEPALPEFIAPVSGYLMKEHSGDTAVFSITMNDYRPHNGVDISASIGDDVFAAADGVITEIWEDPMSGNCISITHNGGAVSIYRNLAPTLPDSITVGASVSSGEVIGSIGETSLIEIAEEPHLHYELTVDGEPVDPAKYMTIKTADTGYEG